MLNMAYKVVALTLLTGWLTGCAEQAKPSSVVPRPVKVEMVTDSSNLTDASFVGIARAKKRTSLSFESNGRINFISVDVGDRVKAGQELARLDDAPARLRLVKAESDFAAANSALAERVTQLSEIESLHKDKIVAPITLLSSQAQHANAVNQLRTAEAALGLAKRELALTRIVAPFDGNIVARHAHPFNDVNSSQPVLQIEGGTDIEIVAMLPEKIAETLKDTLNVQFSTLLPNDKKQQIPLKLERLSSRSENGSLVEAVFQSAKPNVNVRSGSSVSINVHFLGEKSISIPVSALLPDPQKGLGNVFVLNTEVGKLQKQAVKYSEKPLANGRLAIIEGIKQGDMIVTAGSEFLTHGQHAVRYMPQTVLHGVTK